MKFLWFCMFLLSCGVLAQTRQPSEERDQQAPRFRIKTNIVNITATVSDVNRRFVAGLTKENFEIYDDKVRQDIALFSTADSPVTLGIVYDVSGSMTPLSQRSLQALRGLFEYSHPLDEYFILSFSNRSKLVQDFTSLPQEILNKTVFVKSGGSTALYDAIYMALEKVKQGRHDKKALLIISDGIENSSRYSFGELSKLLKETDAQIYAIGLGDGGTLPAITRVSGGLTFLPLEYNEVADVYARIALMLRNQYVIGFYPTSESDVPKVHHIRVNVKAPRQLGRVTVFYREKYESSERDQPVSKP